MNYSSIAPMTDSPYGSERVRFGEGWSTGSASLELADVLQAARAGDDLAFNHLIEHYRGAAERVAHHILRTEEAAADAVQDALIKVYRALPRFQDGNFRSWLLRIVTNTCYDHLRSQKRRRALSLDELREQSKGELSLNPPEEGTDPEKLVTQKESMERLLAAIDSLPPWHRNVVLLVDVHGCDYNEAAQILNLPLGTVKSRLSRARATLRDLLIEAGLVPDAMLQ